MTAKEKRDLQKQAELREIAQLSLLINQAKQKQQRPSVLAPKPAITKPRSFHHPHHHHHHHHHRTWVNYHANPNYYPQHHPAPHRQPQQRRRASPAAAKLKALIGKRIQVVGRALYSKSADGNKLQRIPTSPLFSQKQQPLQQPHYAKSSNGFKLRRISPISGTGNDSNNSSNNNNNNDNSSSAEYVKSLDGKSIFRKRDYAVAAAATLISKSQAIIDRDRRKSSEPCLYFTKFGRCRDEKSCKYKHDGSRAKVCKRFLKGLCRSGDGCPFPHHLSEPETAGDAAAAPSTEGQMPDCIHFLKGSCDKPDCRYRHVKVNEDAPLCRQWLNGACGEGIKCKNKHHLPKQKNPLNSNNSGNNKKRRETKTVGGDNGGGERRVSSNSEEDVIILKREGND